MRSRCDCGDYESAETQGEVPCPANLVRSMKPKKITSFHVQKSELSGLVTMQLGDEVFVMDRACVISLTKELHQFVDDWAFRYVLDHFEELSETSK